MNVITITYIWCDRQDGVSLGKKGEMSVSKAKAKRSTKVKSIEIGGFRYTDFFVVVVVVEKTQGSQEASASNRGMFHLQSCCCRRSFYLPRTSLDVLHHNSLIFWQLCNTKLGSPYLYQTEAWRMHLMSLQQSKPICIWGCIENWCLKRRKKFKGNHSSLEIFVSLILMGWNVHSLFIYT